MYTYNVWNYEIKVRAGIYLLLLLSEKHEDPILYEKKNMTSQKGPA